MWLVIAFMPYYKSNKLHDARDVCQDKGTWRKKETKKKLKLTAK